MKLVTNEFKSGELHEKHVVATWNLGNHLSMTNFSDKTIWCQSQRSGRGLVSVLTLVLIQ